jgi:DNA-binding XRE family transcriptional regulator
MELAEKKKRLEEAGWKMGNAEDFLNLTPTQSAYLDLRIEFHHKLRECMKKRGYTYIQLGKLLNLPKSTIKKIEVGGPGLTIDLMIRSLLEIGVTGKEMANIFLSIHKR